MRCHESHPDLIIPVGGKKYIIQGGNYRSEKARDADVDISLESPTPWSGNAPWRNGGHKGMSCYFQITNNAAPKDAEAFKSMIAWIATHLQDGVRIHVGCIGGHGRTGLVLAALWKHMTGDVDAITSVRKRYCQKAVESVSQVDWLYEHWGIKKVAASHAPNTQRYNKGASGYYGPQIPWRPITPLNKKPTPPLLMGDLFDDYEEAETVPRDTTPRSMDLVYVDIDPMPAPLMIFGELEKI